MEIERNLIDRVSIEQFAEKNDLVMVVDERGINIRTASQYQFFRFYASFKCVEVKSGGILFGEHGDGDTEEEAIYDYARRISGELIVVDAGDPRKRREIKVGVLL